MPCQTVCALQCSRHRPVPKQSAVQIMTWYFQYSPRSSATCGSLPGAVQSYASHYPPTAVRPTIVTSVGKICKICIYASQNYTLLMFNGTYVLKMNKNYIYDVAKYSVFSCITFKKWLLEMNVFQCIDFPWLLLCYYMGQKKQKWRVSLLLQFVVGISIKLLA